MSVQTTADDKRDAAKERLQDTINMAQDTQQLLSDATNPDTWGAGDWNGVYKGALQEAELELAQIAIQLKRILNRL